MAARQATTSIISDISLIMQDRPGLVEFLKAAALILTGCLASFYPVFWADYLIDDPLFFTHNPLVSDPGGIFKIWFSPRDLANFYPLVYTSFWLEYRIWGLSTAGCHGLNLALHASNAILLFVLLRRIHPRVALAAAVLFALHPTRVEVVALASQRKDVLSVFFYLLAAVRWFHYEERGGRSLLIQTALLFVAGLLSKAVICTLPIALFLASWARSGQPPLRRWKPIVGLLVLGLLFAGIAAYWERWRTGASPEMIGLTALTRVQLAARAIWFYLGKLLWPSNLLLVYPKWMLGSASVIAWFFTVATFTAAIILMIRLPRAAKFALAFAVLTISPALGLVDHSSLYFSFAADHYQYLAAAGAFMLFSARASISFPFWPLLGAFARSLVLLALMLTTWNKSSLHHSEEALWRHNVHKTPDNPIPLLGVGTELRKRDALTEAREVLLHTVEIAPDHVEAWYELAGVSVKLGDIEGALAQLHSGADAHAAYPRAERTKALVHDLWGRLLARQSKTDEALSHFESAMSIMPDFAPARHNMGSTLLMVGRFEEARDVFSELVQLKPEDAPARNGLAYALGELGDKAGSLAEYQAAVRLKPDYYTARLNLGMALHAAGQFDQAVEHLRVAADLDPDDSAPILELASALASAGRFSEAMMAADGFLAKHPDNGEVISLRQRLSAAGR